ncbi:MAG: hypothetical protein ACOCVF_03630 [bacterium]
MKIAKCDICMTENGLIERSFCVDKDQKKYYIYDICHKCYSELLDDAILLFYHRTWEKKNIFNQYLVSKINYKNNLGKLTIIYSDIPSSPDDNKCEQISQEKDIVKQINHIIQCKNSTGKRIKKIILNSKSWFDFITSSIFEEVPDTKTMEYNDIELICEID